MKTKKLLHIDALKKHLDAHDEYLRYSRAQYVSILDDEITELGFQTSIVERVQAISTGFWSLELATGAGKTIVAARIALDRLHAGHVVYVCASPTALGDVRQGIVNKFVRVLRHYKTDYTLGAVNDLSRANDISFVTPYDLVRAYDDDPIRLEELLHGSACMIVDEAHHFPSTGADELKIYGQVFQLASQFMGHALVLSMTGTHERLDGKVVMGHREPDVRFTVQDSVDAGRCPEIYGIEVLADIVADGARATGDLYDVHLSDTERLKYYDAVAEAMATVYHRYPKPAAAFVHRQRDAREIAKRFNALLGRTAENGMAVMISRTGKKRRQQIINQINSGDRVGYITCGVGEEAIDLPTLEVVHLIRRTKSNVRNMQAIGRALRVHENKQRALIVDYQMMLKGIEPRLVGMSIFDFHEKTGSRMGRIVNGGPIVAQPDFPEAVLEGLSIEDERQLVFRRHYSDYYREKKREEEQQQQREKQRAEAREVWRGMYDAWSSAVSRWPSRGYFSAYNSQATPLFFPIELDVAFSDYDGEEMLLGWFRTHRLPDIVSNLERSAAAYPDWYHLRCRIQQMADDAAYNQSKGVRRTLSMLHAVGQDPELVACIAIAAFIQENVGCHSPVGSLSSEDEALLNETPFLNEENLAQSTTRQLTKLYRYLDRIVWTRLEDTHAEDPRIAARLYGWHHQSSEVLPTTLFTDHELTSLPRIHTPEDLARTAALNWRIVLAEYIPVVVRAQEQKTDQCNDADVLPFPTPTAEEKTKRTKERLKQMAATGEKRPGYSHDEDRKLADKLYKYTTEGQKGFDAEFTAWLKEHRADWLERTKRTRNK